MENVWQDPVWSQVIAGIILMIIPVLLAIFWKQIMRPIKFLYGLFVTKVNFNKYQENPMFHELFIKQRKPEVFQQLYGHLPEYNHLLDNLNKDRLIYFTISGLPMLNKKGKRLLNRIKSSN